MPRSVLAAVAGLAVLLTVGLVPPQGVPDAPTTAEADTGTFTVRGLRDTAGAVIVEIARPRPQGESGSQAAPRASRRSGRRAAPGGKKEGASRAASRLEEGGRTTPASGEDPDRTVRRKTVPIDGCSVTVTFEKLPAGSYMAAAVHDADGNDTLTTNLLGMPHEGLGTLREPVRIAAGEARAVPVRIHY